MPADPQYPDVPIAPGVPPVLRVIQPPPLPNPLTSDNLKQSGTAAAQWGIFSSTGKAVLDVDSVIAFENATDYTISNFPVEGGKFESYNKVQVPYNLRIVVTKSGKDIDRMNFQKALDDLCASTDFFTVVTSDKTYSPVNPIGYNFQRNAQQGLSMLTVEIRCMQVRVDTAIAFSNSKEPSGAATVNDGPVQTTAPPADTGAPR